MTFTFFSAGGCESVPIRHDVSGHIDVDFLDYLLSTKTSKMVSSIQLAILWLSVPKIGVREEAGTIPGARQSGKEPGARLCFTCFCLSRQYYYLSIVYRLALSDQDQALCA